MTLRVAINGYGRIGRNILRAHYEGGKSHDLAIVSAAMVLADNLGFDTVAEGVETEAQREVLERLGCSQAQGYLFARPVPASEFVRIALALR